MRVLPRQLLRLHGSVPRSGCLQLMPGIPPCTICGIKATLCSYCGTHFCPCMAANHGDGICNT